MRPGALLPEEAQAEEEGPVRLRAIRDVRVGGEGEGELGREVGCLVEQPRGDGELGVSVALAGADGLEGQVGRCSDALGAAARSRR